MNIYHPYEVLADTDDCLYLKESESRERVRFVTLRVFPLFLLFFMWFLLQQVGAIIPMAWNYVMIVIVLFISGLLLFRSYIIECKIVLQKDVYIKIKTIFGIRERNISIVSIEKLSLVKQGKKNCFFITTAKPSSKNYCILKMPISATDEQNISLVKERLERMLLPKIVKQEN